MKIDLSKLSGAIGDFWGGAAAMLVALPSAIAFGVTIYAPLGGTYAAMGAIAGILGVVSIGIIAALLGGTSRLISAPCAPAAAVLSAFVIEYMEHGVSAPMLLVYLVLLGALAGGIQVLFGVIGLGRLIKYMPYPVVSGYLSGVGLYIIASQAPKFLGVPKDLHFWESVSAPALWQWQSIVVGAVTIITMVLAPRFIKVVPAVIIGLFSGIAAYFGVAYFDHSMLTLSGNPLVIGSLGSGGLTDGLMDRVHALGDLNISSVMLLLLPALTLAVLLSIDTLKTCVVLDALTRSNHDSNKELIGQGVGNISSALIGGMPGAGTMGATLVNISSGGTTRLSGVLEGVLALLAFLLLGSLIAWVPIASLAAILIVIGVRMIDRHSFSFLKSRSTVLDFVVIASVVTTALTVSLIMASAVGIVLAIILFIREQISTTIVYSRLSGNEVFSKQVRVQDEVEILQAEGDCSVIYELQGSLFFGTANQLYSMLENDLKTKIYIILDMKRVQSVDLTAAHILLLIKDILHDKGGFLILSHIPSSLPTGQDMEAYFNQVGLIRHHSPVKVFADVDDAIEWVENEIISAATIDAKDEDALELSEFELFEGRHEDTLVDVEAQLEVRSYHAGEKIFATGDDDRDLFLIRKGSVRIALPVKEGQSYHLRSMGKGNFFGEFGFLDGGTRYADAIADTDVEVFVLSRASFTNFALHHKKAALMFMEGLAAILVNRLRITSTELGAHDA
jgi:sulfate permease, SulP family